MTVFRLGCPRILAAALLWSIPAMAQQGQAAPAGAQAPPPTAPAKPQAPKPPPAKNNPFENVPQAVEPAAPPAPQAPKPAAEAEPQAFEDVIEAIEFRGVRRVPQDTLRALIFTKKGAKLDDESIHRDFMALWNTGRFDDIRVEREMGKTGWILRFTMAERRVIRSIKYDGNKSVTNSEILDRFKERKVGLSVESQYDPNKVQRASVVLKEFLSERGRQYATVDPQIEQIPPSSLKVSFVVNEGPKVKVGNIIIENNKAFNS